jgi:hypothetical protein
VDPAGRGVATPPAFPDAGKEEAMDKQENRATGAGGVVLSEDVVDAMIGGFEYLVIMGIDVSETIGSGLVLDELYKVQEMAKGRPVRVVPA